MENILVPKHEVLSTEDAEKILVRYNATREELPKIRRLDPALKGLKPEVGDVIRITRNSPTAGKSFYYRVVIEG